MNRLLFVLILFCFSAEAVAEWTMIQTNDDSNLYVDFDSIKKSGDLIKVLSLNDFYLAQQKQGLSSQWEELVDCKNKKFKALSINYYAENMGKGEILNTTHFNESETNWSDIVQYSIGELKINIVCSK